MKIKKPKKNLKVSRSRKLNRPVQCDHMVTKQHAGDTTTTDKQGYGGDQGVTIVSRPARIQRPDESETGNQA